LTENLSLRIYGVEIGESKAERGFSNLPIEHSSQST